MYVIICRNFHISNLQEGSVLLLTLKGGGGQSHHSDSHSIFLSPNQKVTLTCLQSSSSMGVTRIIDQIEPFKHYLFLQRKCTTSKYISSSFSTSDKHLILHFCAVQVLLQSTVDSPQLKYFLCLYLLSLDTLPGHQDKYVTTLKESI